MLFQVAAILACFVAFIMQLAMHKSPDVPGSQMVEQARRLVLAGLLVLGMYMSYMAYTFGLETVSTPVCIGIILYSLGQILFGVDSLLGNMEAPECRTSRLNNFD